MNEKTREAIIKMAIMLGSDIEYKVRKSGEVIIKKVADEVFDSQHQTQARAALREEIELITGVSQ